jgi:hypothetical protein
VATTEKPKFDIPLDYPALWTCPRTGLKIPKDPDKNVAYRVSLLKRAENDIILQRDILAACRDSFLYWLNTFAFTYHQFETDPQTGKQVPAVQTHWPFVSWPIQDLGFNLMQEAFEGGTDLLTRKSRDMGASWMHLTFIHWLWLTRKGLEAREMSRTEAYVDSNAKSLFWKHDYLNRWLPDWMRPPGVMKRGTANRTKMFLYNELNGSAIAGESTTEFAMSGDRCGILLLDEFAKVENGEAIRTATADVTPCRLINSTPYGAGTEYARWRKSGQIKVFSLMFHNHPQKGRGRYITQEPTTKKYTIHSPWSDGQDKRRTKKEMAQEVYAEDLESGSTFFAIEEIEKHIALFAREPRVLMNVDFVEGVANDQIQKHIQRKNLGAVSFRKAKTGKLRVWSRLFMGRPDQSKTYIFGIDTSKGQGASDSVVSIKCKQTKEKIAEWTCKNTPPYEFARIVVALAIWCGGAKPVGLPFLKWENNGPGWDLGRLLVETFRYPHYFLDETRGQVTKKKKKKYGWPSTREAKRDLLSQYNEAIVCNGMINHSKRGLEQAIYYVEYKNGGIGPADMQDKGLSEMMGHGDIVIADALTVNDDEVPKAKIEQRTAPYKSFKWRMDQHLRKYKKPKGWRRRYSFAG